MKVLVGFTGSSAAKAALELAKNHAKTYNATVHVMTSLEGGSREKIEKVRKAEEILDAAKDFLEKEGVVNEVHQMVRGLTPGEDIIKYANENEIDHIFVGIEKKSKTQKILLGSTAQYIILKADCPVTTVK